MALEIVTPLNLRQAVREIKRYINGPVPEFTNRAKLRFKNKVVKTNDLQFTISNYHSLSKQISRKAENIKISNLVYSDKLTIGDWQQYNWGDEISSDALFNYTENNRKLYLLYHFTNITTSRKLSKLSWNNIFCVVGLINNESGESEEMIINITEKVSNTFMIGDKNIDDYFHLYVTIPDIRHLISFQDYSFDYIKFYPIPIIYGKGKRNNKFLSMMIQNSELWITDESEIITPETESQYYVYIEHWNSKRQRWTAYMNPENIYPINFSDLEKHISEYDGRIYYQLPFDAYTFLKTLKKIEKNPSLYIRVGIATDFQYDSIEDEKYINPRLIGKSDPIIIKIHGHRFKGIWFDNSDNEMPLKIDLIQMHFTADHHRYYYDA